MKRIVIVTALLVLPAAAASAQLEGLPIFNSPKGGTGVSIYADLGLPGEQAGKGTAFAGRASVGLANITITGGVSSWKPDGAPESGTSYGGTVGFRVFGGGLLPVAVNVIAGGAGHSGLFSGSTTALVGAGVSAGLPTPGISIEPYATLANVWSIASGTTDSQVALTFGANLGFGMMGAHLAYTTVSDGGASRSVFGIGAHVSLKAPI